VPLSDVYARLLHLAAFRAAHALGLGRSTLAEGAYAWVSGLTYETRGEAGLLAAAGATVVGMSTVPEVVVARDEGVRVLMLSLVTNMVVGVFPGMGVKSMREELRVDAEVRRGLGWLGVCCASGNLSFLGLARRGGVGTPADADCVA
jgi:purine-nucleoside phosphorylase